MHTHEEMENDLGGIYVLVSDKFWYFGSKPIELSNKYEQIIPSRVRDYLRFENDEGDKAIRALCLELSSYDQGIVTFPKLWPHNITTCGDSCSSS